MRTLYWILVTGLMLALFAAPAAAQGDKYVTLTFKVRAAEQAPANAAYFALYGLPQSEWSAVQLKDADGDGVYTGTARWMVGGKQLIVSLVQGTGVQRVQYGNGPSTAFPGEPVKTIREWREPTDVTQDTTSQTNAVPSGMPSTGAGGAQFELLAAAALAAAGVGPLRLARR